jgi:hypothetical protein
MNPSDPETPAAIKWLHVVRRTSNAIQRMLFRGCGVVEGQGRNYELFYSGHRAFLRMWALARDLDFAGLIRHFRLHPYDVHAVCSALRFVKHRYPDSESSRRELALVCKSAYENAIALSKLCKIYLRQLKRRRLAGGGVPPLSTAKETAQQPPRPRGLKRLPFY